MNAFLLVPGFTATKIITRGQKWLQGASFDPSKATDEETYEGVVDRDRARERGASSEVRSRAVAVRVSSVSY